MSFEDEVSDCHLSYPGLLLVFFSVSLTQKCSIYFVCFYAWRLEFRTQEELSAKYVII